MTPALVYVAVLGVACLVLGALGMDGRLGRSPTGRYTNHTAMVLAGAFLLDLVLVSLAPDGSALSMILSVPAAVACGLFLYAWLVRPPRWLQPRWQQVLDDNRRHGRRARRAARRGHDYRVEIPPRPVGGPPTTYWPPPTERRTCSRCTEDLPPAAMVCSFCETPLGASCVECSAALPADTANCPACGTWL